MTAPSKNIGPFVINAPIDFPESGQWYMGKRRAPHSTQPNKALIKCVLPDESGNALNTLKQQYKILNEMNDPRFLKPFGFFEGQNAIALPYFEGTPLSKMRGQKLVVKPPTLVELLLEVSEGMTHAHECAVVHGHLSARHVLLGKTGQCVLFGLGEADPGVDPCAWLAPERALGHPPTTLSDIWSIGALAIFLMTAQAPWEYSSSKGFGMGREYRGIVRSIESRWPALCRLLALLMDTNPSHRIDSMRAVRTQLLKLRRETPGSAQLRELSSALRSLEIVPKDSPTPPVGDEAQDHPNTPLPESSAHESVNVTGDFPSLADEPGLPTQPPVIEQSEPTFLMSMTENAIDTEADGEITDPNIVDTLDSDSSLGSRLSNRFSAFVSDSQSTLKKAKNQTPEPEVIAKFLMTTVLCLLGLWLIVKWI